MSFESQIKLYVTRLLKVSKKRAKGNGWHFDLDRSWLFSKLEQGVCEASGLPFELDFKQSTSSRLLRSPWGPSIDRLNSNFGYTKENCRVVCTIYNLLKSTGTDAHVEEICAALIKGKI